MEMADVYNTIRSSIGSFDAIWMIPDTAIFTVETTRDVLLVALRNKIPVIGISPLYVKAGALFSLSCNYTAIGKQGAEIAAQILNNHTSPADVKIADPTVMDLSINTNIAEYLGKRIPDSMLREAANVYQ
jgi:putative ABC transport system substrate-binding protein